MTTHHISQVALGALAVVAVSLLVEVSPGQDVTFPLFMLGAPIATGIVLGRRWRLGAAAWFCAAMVWLVSDWAINHEDVAFHAMAAVICAGLVALGAGIVRAARTFDSREQSSA
jgi:hypothetical protein